MAQIVIVGTGLAGYTAARELRRAGSTDALCLITADDGAFYSKPMLSNALAQGRTAQTLIQHEAGAMAASLDAQVLTGRRVDALDLARHSLAVDDEAIAYDELVLAVGADPIRLPLAGDGAAEVLSVNDRQDYAQFRRALAAARHVTLLGGGLIGCEFANDLRGAGFAVTVVDPALWPLGRLVPQAIGEALTAGLAAIGVAWRLGHVAQRIDRCPGGGLQVCLDDGECIASDLVLSAVGLRPRTGLALAAGLQVARGIVADTVLTTSDPHVHTLGDCAEIAGQLRPYVLPITHAARALARTLTGAPTAVAWPPMPVVVKTPAQPVVVCPPPPDAAGSWRLATPATDDGLIARFEDPSGRLLGFALCGAATARRQAMASELAAA